MTIQQILQNAIAIKQELLDDTQFEDRINAAVQLCVTTLKQKGKIHFCGNGGSAADAQHLAAELSGKFYFDRPPLNAEALHVNSSFLTAVANDYDFNSVYARMLQAAAKPNDVLFAISTSGESENVVSAARLAQQMGVRVIGFTGSDGGILADYCNIIFKVPSTDTPRIQENHILIGHIICELIEKQIFE